MSKVGKWETGKVDTCPLSTPPYNTYQFKGCETAARSRYNDASENETGDFSVIGRENGAKC